MTTLPTARQLIDAVDAAEVTELDRVRAAVVMADDLGTLGDQVVNHFVGAARQAGCSWSQIGGQLGVSKQAAQQAFVAPTPRRARFGRRGETRPRGRWSAALKAVIVAARDEAAALGHDHVGTEHLLLALGEGSGVAAEALRRLGVDQDALRGHVVAVAGGGTTGTSGRHPFTPRAKKVLELAVRESIRLQHDELRTEHLLLAVVREGEGVAAQILVQKLGIDLARVRQTVLDLLSDGGPRTPGEPPTG
jgi:hypothetical protein